MLYMFRKKLNVFVLVGIQPIIYNSTAEYLNIKNCMKQNINDAAYRFIQLNKIMCSAFIIDLTVQY